MRLFPLHRAVILVTESRLWLSFVRLQEVVLFLPWTTLAYRFPFSLPHAFKLSFVWGEQACSLSPLTTDGRYFFLFFFFLVLFAYGRVAGVVRKLSPYYMCTREYRHAYGFCFLSFSLVLNFAHYVQIVLRAYLFFCSCFFFLHFRFNWTCT